ncbi:hypothetical protein [Bacillus inaquosorum]|uniref:hypothetical protein n=1 Tax=Bacillus inaquosorum TaxID=483913 RepID=UPI00227EA321|nr:hypothetical protein [Bacillus inaquosorum]MCY9176276.1 hypothetical protein [Bacillus inaquosorum]MCY9299146.1 hypothetical protein [Bacillus inaquosorum]MED1171117.1 hypothetical protein [Bacillus inaquosorum]
MPTRNYVYLAGCGYDTINTGYFAIRTYSSGVSSADPKFSAGHMGADGAAAGIFEKLICFSSY